MLTKFLLCLSFAFLVQAQGPWGGWEPAQPYEMGYATPTEDGGSLSQQEVGDESNSKRGSYTITTPEGTFRVVNYIADIDGFRASIETNEPGTAGHPDPAGVQITSSAWSPVSGGGPSGHPLARRAGRI